MSQLFELQHQFFSYILAANQTELDAEQHPFFAAVVQQGEVSIKDRLDIYANGYFARLKSTIETDHEILAKYLGDDLFETMAFGYINHHPSAFRSLRQYCDSLPEFLAINEPFSLHSEISDIAKFERRLLAAFDAQDSTRIEFSTLQCLAPDKWPECRLRFHPSTQLFCCHSNAVEIWQALKAEQIPPAPEYNENRYWLLWRGQTRLTEFTSLAPYQFELISGFLKGQSFANQCELMLNYFDENQAPSMVLMSLQRWFEVGIIQGLSHS
ncbi:MAG: putative DNA-binding domain-containing protein [Parashewanella sp.]